MITWTKLPQSEIKLIDRIAFRADDLAAKLGGKYHMLDCMMDLTACHTNGNPLNLRALLDAPDSQFGHDVFGVRKHIDRGTGQLMDCFSPRHSLGNR